MRIPIPLCLIFLLTFTACSKRTVKHLQNGGIHVNSALSIKSSHAIPDKLLLQYLGCGGLLIQQNSQLIMIDPFFSHQSFLRIGRSIFLGGKLKPMKKQLAFGKNMIKDSLHLTDKDLRDNIKGIFSAHGHYDHLMDVPFIHHEWLGAKAEIFANTSSVKTIRNVVPSKKLHDVEKIASIRNQAGDSIDFQSDGSLIRVYPIFADHNPHSRNIKLFAGSAVNSPRKYQHYLNKTSVNDWLEGQTLSFLIDFVKGDQIYFRIFLQSSSCQFPNGLPPATLLNERSVDLAILGVASYHFSENTYPCEFLDALKPANLLFIHWEDFFRKVHQRPKTVKTNDIPRFFKKVFSKCEMGYVMPLPGTVIQIGG